MADDLFAGFATYQIEGSVGPIFCRAGGSGPPLVLLHGFPQTHVMWHKIAPALAERFSVVTPDLRGYGQSAAPEGDGAPEAFSKRAMAGDILRLMAELGHARFAIVGHDRGARVGYRLALDAPQNVTLLALLDILPTLLMWEQMDAARAMQVYHWMFLAQPKPLPERLIGGDPVYFLEHTLASWTKTKSLAPFDPRALAAYRAAAGDSACIHAWCADYRAGAGIDLVHDQADKEARRHLACPTFILWGDNGIPAAGASPLAGWRASFAPDAKGAGIDSGHFVAEENPAETLALLLPFLGS
jgi:haloacetate dehalogenase